MKVNDKYFIAYPSAVHYAKKGAASSKKGKDPINQLIWGDFAQIKEIAGKWIKVRSRQKTGWVRKENLQEDRILEVNFVDIGQGDGCHIQTAEDKSIIIDAGEKDNMYRFLRWRFGKFNKKMRFESFVISHPDKDHYNGFNHLIDHENVFIDSIYHNTIVEQVTAKKSSLGSETKFEGKKYLSGLVRSYADLKKLLKSKAKRGGRLYPNMLKDAIDGGRVKKIEGLLASQDWDDPAYYPGYAPEDDRGMTLKILGPVPKTLRAGKLGLPYFNNPGKTKNGHSIVLLLEIGSIKILLGGDLNEYSQEYLLEHYTGLSANPKTSEAIDELVREGRKFFQVDVAKACHHGSSDVMPVFLKSTNPLITVISSGDNEPHSHPRPNTLGMVGKYSRSDKPFIFSTELARSSKELIKKPNQVRAELKEDLDAQYKIIDSAKSTDAQKKKAEAKVEGFLKIIERSVASYGMINLRTDGKKMIMCQRLERDRKKDVRWDIYKFECDDRDRLEHVKK